MIQYPQILWNSHPKPQPDTFDPTLRLLEFSKTLNELELQHETKAVPTPSELNSWNLETNKMYECLFYDLQKQLNYLIGSYPGKVVYMTSIVTATRQLGCFVTQDLQGDFHLILKKQDPLSEQCYELHKNGASAYIRTTPFLTRLKYFLSQKPAHLKQFDSNDIDYFVRYFYQIEDRIKLLKLNEIIWLENNQGLKLGIKMTCDGEYQAILDTGRDNERYLRLDSPEKMVLIKHQERFLEQAAIDFISRIKEIRTKRLKYGWPDELSRRIKIEDQPKIYDYIDQNETFIARLETGRAFRISKHVSRLALTLQVIRGAWNEYMLMLDTKNKRALVPNKVKPIVDKTESCSIASAWRIDQPEPEEWINKTNKDWTILDAEYECMISQNLYDTMGDSVNISYVGEQYINSGVKRCHFSKRLMGDLSSSRCEKIVSSSPEIREKIIEMLIDEIAGMHARGVIYQDLKLKNIFLSFRQSEYKPTLADFSLSINSKDPRQTQYACATNDYESPEIVMAYQDMKTVLHDYFHGSKALKLPSYSYELVKKNQLKLNEQQKDYSKPHFANDMWALGIVIFELRFGCKPRFHNLAHTILISEDPLLKGLLTENREERLTSVQAKELYARLRSKPTHKLT